MFLKIVTCVVLLKFGFVVLYVFGENLELSLNLMRWFGRWLCMLSVVFSGILVCVSKIYLITWFWLKSYCGWKQNIFEEFYVTFFTAFKTVKKVFILAVIEPIYWQLTVHTTFKFCQLGFKFSNLILFWIRAQKRRSRTGWNSCIKIYVKNFYSGIRNTEWV